MASLLISNADAIVTVDDQDRVLTHANLLIEDGVITYLGPEAREADQVIDGRGSFVYPGLINTHHHLYQTFTRNFPQVQKMELFPWLTALYEIWRGLTDSRVYYSALTGMGELVRFGCTTVMDHHYVFPRDGAEQFLARQFDAAAALGIRFHATRGSMSRGKSDGGLPPDDLVQPVDVILRESQRLVEAFHDPSPFSYRQMSLAPCSPFSVTTDLLKESAVLARSLGVRLHTHLCETKDEERFCLEVVGQRPLAYMPPAAGWGRTCGSPTASTSTTTSCGFWPKPRPAWLTAGVQYEALQRRVPHPGNAAAGVPVGLAVDGSASNDCSNLLQEIRAAYLLHRLTWSDAAPTGYDLLKMATCGSAAVLGRSDIGQLAVGKAGDLFLLDATGLDLVGATLDPGCLLGTVGYSKPAKWVVVGGKPVAQAGRLLGIDEAETAEAAHREMRAMLQAAGYTR